MNSQDEWERKWTAINIFVHQTAFADKVYDILKNTKVKTILELGCGNGRDAFFFAKKGYDITALEFSTAALQQIKDKHKTMPHLKITPVFMDILNLQFPDNSFDCVYASCSLHYFTTKQTQEIFNKIKHILKPNGHFFFICKSIQDKRYGEGVQLGQHIFQQGESMRHFFTIEFATELLNNAGFTIEFIREAKEEHFQLKKELESYQASFIESYCKNTS